MRSGVQRAPRRVSPPKARSVWPRRLALAGLALATLVGGGFLARQAQQKYEAESARQRVRRLLVLVAAGNTNALCTWLDQPEFSQGLPGNGVNPCLSRSGDFLAFVTRLDRSFANWIAQGGNLNETRRFYGIVHDVVEAELASDGQGVIVTLEHISNGDRRALRVRRGEPIEILETGVPGRTE